MKNKIVIISSEFPPGPGGIGKHAYDLSRALADRGNQVAVFTSQDFSSNDEINKFNTKQSATIKIIRFERTGYFTYLSRWNKVINFMEKGFPEYVIFTGRFSLWI